MKDSVAEWSKVSEVKILVLRYGRSNLDAGECRLAYVEHFIVKLLSTRLPKEKMISTLFLSF